MLEAERLVMTLFTEKASSINNSLEEFASVTITGEVTKICEKTGIKKFMIGGSHASSMIYNACATLSRDDVGVEVVPLVSNDVGVFHGEFISNASKSLVVDKSKIKKVAVDGISMEVNTVECGNLSPGYFFVNNDINITVVYPCGLLTG